MSAVHVNRCKNEYFVDVLYFHSNLVRSCQLVKFPAIHVCALVDMNCCS